MSDVFDEDLMRELGLDPEDIENVKKAPQTKPKETPQPKSPPAQPSPAASRSVNQAPQPQKQVAEKVRSQEAPRSPRQSAPPAPKAETPLPEEDVTLHGETPEEMAEKEASQKKPSVKKQPKEDPQAYSEKMTQNLPVHLAAVLAKKSIPLKDVIEMQIGEVIDFKKLPQDTIDLVANGKLVAKAELVMVDGRVGARIVKLVK